MRRFRQTVLLLLLALLSAGPALAALPLSGCMARQAACPMCAHPAQPMHCPGETAGRASAWAHADTPAAKGAAPALAACFCSAQQVARTADLQIPVRPAQPLGSALPVQALAWPRASLVTSLELVTSRPGVVSLRPPASLPLRV